MAQSTTAGPRSKSRELAEAREQQFAKSAILYAISNAPSDAQAAVQKIAASAARLCDAYDAGVLQRADKHLRLVAHHGAIPPAGPIGQGALAPARAVLIGRTVLDRQMLQVTDLQAETEEYPEGREIARRLGHRTILVVPLIRNGEAIGCNFYPAERDQAVHPPTDRSAQDLRRPGRDCHRRLPFERFLQLACAGPYLLEQPRILPWQGLDLPHGAPHARRASHSRVMTKPVASLQSRRRYCAPPLRALDRRVRFEAPCRCNELQFRGHLLS
jgi:GAF domain